MEDDICLDSLEIQIETTVQLDEKTVLPMVSNSENKEITRIFWSYKKRRDTLKGTLVGPSAG